MPPPTMPPQPINLTIPPVTSPASPTTVYFEPLDITVALEDIPVLACLATTLLFLLGTMVGFIGGMVCTFFHFLQRSCPRDVETNQRSKGSESEGKNAEGTAATAGAKEEAEAKRLADKKGAAGLARLAALTTGIPFAGAERRAYFHKNFKNLVEITMKQIQGVFDTITPDEMMDWYDWYEEHSGDSQTPLCPLHYLVSGSCLTQQHSGGGMQKECPHLAKEMAEKKKEDSIVQPDMLKTNEEKEDEPSKSSAVLAPEVSSVYYMDEDDDLHGKERAPRTTIIVEGKAGASG